MRSTANASPATSRNFCDQIAHLEGGLLLFVQVEDDAPGVHHDQAVAEAQGQLHVVRDHERGEAARGDDRGR